MQIPTVEDMNLQIRRLLQENTRLQAELIEMRKRNTQLGHRLSLWKWAAKRYFRKVHQ